MTPETKSEVIIVGIAGAVLLYIWARNHAAGAGTGLEGVDLPGFNNNQTPLGGAPLFNIPAPVAGETFDYTGSPWSLPAPNSFGQDAGSAAACNCANGGQASSTFGSQQDLAAWLASQPGFNDVLNQSNNWF